MGRLFGRTPRAQKYGRGGAGYKTTKDKPAEPDSGPNSEREVVPEGYPGESIPAPLQKSKPKKKE